MAAWFCAGDSVVRLGVSGEEMAALDGEGQVEGRLQELAQRRQSVLRLALGS